MACMNHYVQTVTERYLQAHIVLIVVLYLLFCIFCRCLKRGAVFVVDNMQEYAKRSKQQVRR